MTTIHTTQAQQFAAAYAADMAQQMLKTIKRVRQAATVIMLVAMVTSYTHQADYLASIGTPALGAWTIPLALDALTFLCVKVLGTPGMAQAAKTMAIRVLVFPVVASAGINFAGPGALVTKLVFVIAVLMIPAAELVASRIKPDFAAMDAMERDITPATAVEPVDEELVARRRAAAALGVETRRRNREEAARVVAEAEAIAAAQPVHVLTPARARRPRTPTLGVAKPVSPLTGRQLLAA